MKKSISLFMPVLALLLCLLNTSNAWGQMVYNSVVSNVSVVQSDEVTTNVFTLTIKQDGIRNGSQYANATVTLILESNDRTLEGTYSTAYADGNNKINASSVFDWSSYHRTLRPNSAVTSTFVIKKLSEGQYAIDDEGGTLCFTNGSSNYHYKYCYAYTGGASYANTASDFNFTFTPKYATAPTGVTANAVAGTTATVSWTSDESAWQYVCLPSATSLTEARWSSNKVSTNSKSVDLTGLTPATAYTFYVISDRGSNGTSVIASTEFTTGCDVISTIPWNYGFEDATLGETPTCWAQVLSNASGWFRAISGTDYKHAGSKAARLYGGTSTSTVTAVFPEFEVSINNLAVAFWYKAKESYYDDWYGEDIVYGHPQFGYITDVDDASTFVAVGEPLAQSESYVLVENLTVSGAPNGARFALRYTGGTSTDYLYIDDITVSEKPACSKPTGVSAGSETAEGATITWSAGSESAWKLQVSEGDAASWGEEIAVATNSKVLTGLKANTLYYVRVKADCGGGNVSEWSENVSFTTLCGIINVSASSSWNIDFQGLSDHIVPDCWDNSASTTTTSWGTGYIWGTYSKSGNTMLAIDNSVLDDGTALINTPEITIPDDGNTYELTFDYSNVALIGKNLIVKIAANGGAFVEKGSYVNMSGYTSSFPGAFSNAVISLADYNGKTIQVQFFTEPTSGTSSEGGAMFVDNISVHKVSSCAVPTALTAGNLSANSARISWTAGSSESAWRLQYRSVDGDWSAEQAISSSAQRDLTGLSANTEYLVRVKAYCDAEDQSNWSDVLSFTTLCAAAAMPFSEEFSNGSELPSCWEATTTASYGWSAYEKSGAYAVQLRTGSSGEATLRLPAISLSEDAILRFEWKNANGAQVNLYISTDGGSSRTMIPNDLSGVHADWTTKVFDLSAYTDETALIYFVANFTTANQYAYLDDVEVVERPCEMILNISATPITGGATISWNGEVKKIRYTTGSNAWSYATPANYAGPHTLTGLTPARSYRFCLLPECSAEEESNWTDPVYFISNSTESVPYFNDFEAETAGEVPFNWSRISSSEYPQVSYDSYAYVDFGDEGNSVKFYGVNSQTLILPEFDATLSDLKISFHYRNRDCTMELGYVESDGTTFVAIETLPNQTGYSEFPYEKDLTSISSDAAKLAIRYSNAGGSAQAWVDNMSVDYATCGQPAGLSVSAITANSAHISWSASERATETNYQYIRKVWSEEEPDWSSATLISSSVLELDLSGLSANTEYEFYLRSYCGVSDQSTPVKVEFRTETADVVFEDVASATNNESRLADLLNQTVNVTIKRPLPFNGDYSTICLPFNLSVAQIADPDCPLHGFVIKEFNYSQESTDVVDIFLSQVTSIEAGKPYFVRYAGATSDNRLNPLTFRNVKITRSTPAEVETSDDAQPYGIFNPHALIADDKTTYFLSSNNTLYWPSENGTINGFRVYIHINPNSTIAHALQRGAPLRIREEESPATGLDEQNIQETDRTRKILRSGQMIIIRDGKEYNAQGIRIQ